jgi:hypothetical protein
VGHFVVPPRRFWYNVALAAVFIGGLRLYLVAKSFP